jgi:hypothetical protein
MIKYPRRESPRRESNKRKSLKLSEYKLEEALLRLQEVLINLSEPRRSMSKSHLLRGGSPIVQPREEKAIPYYLLPAYTPGFGTHLYTCSNCGKENIRTEDMPYNFCQRCIDFTNTNIRMVENTENEVNKILVNIQDEERNLDSIYEKRENEQDILDSLYENQANEEDIEIQKKKVDRFTRRIDKKIQNIDELKKLFEEKNKIALEMRKALLLHRELVSDSVRVYGNEVIDIDEDGTTSGRTIETHCTIFRPMKAHENRYFGHVSLYDRQYVNRDKKRENVWHYGVYVPNKKIVPRNITRIFWAFPDLLPDARKVLINDARAPDFDMGFPLGTTVSNVLLEHFNTCITVFDIEKWSNQEWGREELYGNTLYIVKGIGRFKGGGRGGGKGGRGGKGGG